MDTSSMCGGRDGEMIPWKSGWTTAFWAEQPAHSFRAPSKSQWKALGQTPRCDRARSAVNSLVVTFSIIQS
jgi:hypothetical protein